MESLRILFVDDEPQVLHGLRRLLRPMRDKWAMHFATSAARALELQEAERFDVVVSDIRMPDMDGVELLERIRQTAPDTVRIALSGHSEPKELLRAAGTVHRYLTKPCRPNELRATIERTRALRQVLGDAGEALSQALFVKDLRVGMILNEGVTTRDGLLIVARGAEVSPPLLEKLRTWSELDRVVEPLVVESTSQIKPQARE